MPNSSGRSFSLRRRGRHERSQAVEQQGGVEHLQKIHMGGEDGAGVLRVRNRVGSIPKQRRKERFQFTFGGCAGCRGVRRQQSIVDKYFHFLSAKPNLAAETPFR